MDKIVKVSINVADFQTFLYSAGFFCIIDSGFPGTIDRRSNPGNHTYGHMQLQAGVWILGSARTTEIHWIHDPSVSAFLRICPAPPFHMLSLFGFGKVQHPVSTISDYAKQYPAGIIIAVKVTVISTGQKHSIQPLHPEDFTIDKTHSVLRRRAINR